MDPDAALAGVTRLFLDTVPIIYFLEGNPRYLAAISHFFNSIGAGYRLSESRILVIEDFTS